MEENEDLVKNVVDLFDNEGIYGENTSEYKERFEKVSQGEVFEKELFGRIFRFNLKSVAHWNGEGYTHTQCLTMSIDAFNFENDIVKSGVLLFEIPLTSITYIRGHEELDWLYGLLTHEYISGFNGFLGKLVKVKLRDIIHDERLESRVDEIIFLDGYKESGRLIMNGNDSNAERRWVERIFRWDEGNKIQLSSMTWDEGRKYLSYHIGEFPRITGTEIAAIVGQPLEGNFDKEQYKWIIRMDLFNHKGEKYASYAYDVYDYKSYGDITMDKLYPYNIGGGCRIEGEKLDDALTYFIVYLYNKIIENRKKTVESLK